MDSLYIIKAILALIFIISIILLMAFIARKLDYFKYLTMNPKNSRIKVIESLQLDQQSRIILFVCDDTEHLVLSSKNGSILIR